MGVAQQLVDEFAPWLVDNDGTYLPDFETWLRALGSMFAFVELLADDQPDGTPGWSTIWDVDTCPTVGLGWLTQFVGERLPAGISDADARQWIRDAPNQIRGTKNGIAHAAQRHLTGTRTVMMHPRYKLDGTADPDYLTVLTLAGETPSITATTEDILGAMPADIVLNYSAPTQAIWAEVSAEYATWAAVQASNATWADVLQNTVVRAGGGWLVWSI